MLATIASASLQGIDAELVQVEVNANETGEPKLILVGLPDAAVKESDDRVFSALGNSGFETLRARTTVNLAPGHLRKEGPIYDLPIALAFLVATGQLRTEILGDFLIAGELGLSGSTRPVRGALAMARLARKLGKKAVILPGVSAEEAALVESVSVYRADSLDRAFRFLAGQIHLTPLAPACGRPAPGGDFWPTDFSEIKGQPGLRRAVEIAVSGAHNLIMIGPPGSGKSMVAKRIPTILPPPTLEERLEILSIESAAGATLGDANSSWGSPPFRAPHHSASDIALLGGGVLPGPGEISLAHNGVLFLDELPEFRRAVLEVLRQPLEDGTVTISRSAGKITLPCGFMLVAAMNPCPCGHLGDPKNRCRCTPAQIRGYRSRVSGPLLDRIDLHVEAPALSVSDLRSDIPGESSGRIRTRVLAARALQKARLDGTKTTVNARMTHAQIRRFCRLDDDLGDLLQQAMEKLNLSARAYDRILKVARTIADLASSENIAAPHLLEAIQYRSLDREVFY
jgi:magnesium chelatase family protein